MPHDSEIIVIINSEESIRLPETRGRLRVIHKREKLGYSRAINIGALEAKGEYLIFCDADAFMMPGWVEAHMAKHEGNSSVGITSSKMLCSRTGRTKEFGIGRTFYNHFHPFRGLLPDHKLVCEERRVQMACSACMAIKKDLFFDLGMMDEKLAGFYQDLDLCLRLKWRDKQCWVLPDSLGYHRGGDGKYRFAAAQVDERGYFTAKNITALEHDFDTYIHISCKDFERTNRLEREYYLADLSTLNRTTVAEYLRNLFRIGEAIRVPASGRDVEGISLLDTLDVKLLRTKSPIAFFADTFVALRHNLLWLHNRRRDDDIVIDRHSNIQRLKDIVSGII